MASQELDDSTREHLRRRCPECNGKFNKKRDPTRHEQFAFLCWGCSKHGKEFSSNDWYFQCEECKSFDFCSKCMIKLPVVSEQRIELNVEDGRRHNILIFGSWNRFKKGEELEYQGRQIFATSIALPCGTHYYRFLIDEEKWIISYNVPIIVKHGIEYNNIHVTEDDSGTITKNKSHEQLIKQLTDSKSKLQQKYDGLLLKYQTEASLRRKYSNLIGDLRGNIYVFCRIRPLLPFEIKKQYTSCINIDRQCNYKLNITDDKNNKLQFEFDIIYGPESTDYQIHEDITDYIKTAMDGYNISILTYGQTGAGKTYTMNSIKAHTLEYLFKTAKLKSSEFEYKFKISLFEIYNDKITDLIENAPTYFRNQQCIDLVLFGYIRCIQKSINNIIPIEIKVICKTYMSNMEIIIYQKSKKKGEKIKIKRLPDGSVIIAGLTTCPIDSYENFITLKQIAKKNKVRNNTDFYIRDTRIVKLCAVEIEGIDMYTNTRLMSKLWMVDLCGSQRVKKSGAYGESVWREVKQLCAFGDVLQALQKKAKFIPYRNSTMTDAMSNAFGGNAKTIVILNCCSAKAHVFETVSTLKFGQRIQPIFINKKVKNTKTKKKK
eukprot:177652_1